MRTKKGEQVIKSLRKNRKKGEQVIKSLRKNRKKREQVIKSLRKTVKRLLPSKIKLQVSFTGNKLSSCFIINDKTKFEHKHDVIYLGTWPETKCNDNYIVETKRQISKRVNTTRAETLHHIH